MVFGIPSKQDLNQVVTEAPQHLFEGIVQAVAFIPDQMKGAAVFGAGIWNNLTPEQKATVEQAIAKLIVTAAEAYVKKGS
jgi:hypothetical protein